MYETDITITSDVRREMTEHVIPSTIEFLKSIGSFYSLADIDCMDCIRIEEPFHRLGLDGMFAIVYRAGEKKGRVSCSFLTFPASGIEKRMRRVLNKAGMHYAAIWPEVYYLFSDSRDPGTERTKWTIEFDLEVDSGDLCETFTHAYEEVIRAAHMCFLEYRKYEKKKDRRSHYSKPYRMTMKAIYGAAAVHFNPYGQIFGAFHLGERAFRTTIDHGSYSEKVYITEGSDATSIAVHVKRDQLCSTADPAVTCETEAEDDIGETYRFYLECTQSFSIAAPHGNVRSLLHKGETIARLHYVRQDLFVLQVPDLLLEKPLAGRDETGEKIRYLIVMRDPDGSYSFFAETGMPDSREDPYRPVYQHRLVARAGINSYDTDGTESGEKYELSLLYALRHLLPFCAAIEDWVFEPGTISAAGDEDSGKTEERSFHKLNEDGRRLISIVRKWASEEPREEDSFFDEPGARVLTYLEWNHPDLLKDFWAGRDRELMEDVCFVQRVKNATYGLDSDQGLSEIRTRLKAVGLGDPPGCRQVTMTDILGSDRYPASGGTAQKRTGSEGVAL